MRLIVIALAALFPVLSACGGGSPTQVALDSFPTAPSESGLVEATVVNVVDGDTIDVSVRGREYRVRYIGVDTPETVHPTVGVEAFGREASARNRELVSGKTVLLEKDVSETDRYGRLLRYVWLDQETMVNAVLLAEGLAEGSTHTQT